MENQQNKAVKLTEFSKSSGCGCKIEPKVLQDILHAVQPGFRSDKLLVGNEHADDAAVYDLGNGDLLLHTTDFFTPIADDPYLFGTIAAANALSDIWAMGGKPIMANVILGWPVNELGPYLANEVMQGAADLCSRMSVSLAGGHSIDIPTPVFGLSVNGICKKHELKTNAGAKPGDYVLLTKPLGIGMLATAIKRGLANEKMMHDFTHHITKTNFLGAEIAKFTGVHAMTDITGFGLCGHAMEICKASSVSITLHFTKIPLIESSEQLAKSFVLADNAYRNWNACEPQVNNQIDESFPYLCDPQTNGGLLITVNEETLPEIMKTAEKNDVELFIIGKVTQKQNHLLTILP